MNAATAYNAHPGMFEIKEIRDVAFANYDPNTVWVHKASNTDLDVEDIIYRALSEYTEITRETELMVKEIQPGVRVYQPGCDPKRVYLWEDGGEHLMITAEALGIALTIFAYQQLAFSNYWALFYERQEIALRSYADGYTQRDTLTTFSWM